MGLRPNVFYELSYATGLGKRVIVTAQDTAFAADDYRPLIGLRQPPVSDSGVLLIDCIDLGGP